MLKAEFSAETLRLYKGSRCEVELTPERMDALWGEYGHLPHEVWKTAATRLLLDPIRPTVVRIDAAIANAEETYRLAEIQRRNSEASGGVPAVLDRALHANSEITPEFRHAFRVTNEMVCNGATPGAVADVLEQLQPTLGNDDLSNYIASLRASPDHWPGTHYRQRDGQRMITWRPLPPRELFG